MSNRVNVRKEPTKASPKHPSRLGMKCIIAQSDDRHKFSHKAGWAQPRLSIGDRKLTCSGVLALEPQFTSPRRMSYVSLTA